MFRDAFEAFLTRHCPRAKVRQLESGTSVATLWQLLVESGFLEIMASEARGGAHQDLAETLPLLYTLGAHTVPLPVGEAIILRALPTELLLDPARLPTLAPALTREPSGDLLAPRVPHGMIADDVVAEYDGEYWLLDAGQADRLALGLHNDTSADLRWPLAQIANATRAKVEAPVGHHLHTWSAALYAALLAGALTRCMELTLQYSETRVQFGKSISKFQAIQHQLAVMAEHVAAARMAATYAFASGEHTPREIPAALAKARASEAVTVVAPIAHAVHGAIGITAEYDLSLITHRLHAWRITHGSELYWNHLIGRACLQGGFERAGDFIRAMVAE